MAPSECETKLRPLGFVKGSLGFELTIGTVVICAAENPWKGVVLIFTSIQSRTMTQFDVAFPARCSIEQIAALIYVNLLTALREHAPACREHFEALQVPIFQ